MDLMPKTRDSTFWKIHGESDGENKDTSESKKTEMDPELVEF